MTFESLQNAGYAAILVISAGFWLWSHRESLKQYRTLADRTGLKARRTLTRGFYLTGERGLVSVELCIRQEGGRREESDIVLSVGLPTQGRLEALVMPPESNSLQIPVSAVLLKTAPKIDAVQFTAWARPEEPARAFLTGPKGAGDLFLSADLPELKWLLFGPKSIQFSLAEVPEPEEFSRLLSRAEKLAIAAADV